MKWQIWQLCMLMWRFHYMSSRGVQVMYIEYCNVLVGLICSIIVSSVLFFIAFYLLSPKKKDFMQNSAYECGFQPFNESTNRFDVRYYLVAILFILFDLEVMFLVP